MTIHPLPLTDRDHHRAERLLLPGNGMNCETSTPLGNVSVSVHGRIYIRKNDYIVMSAPECDALIAVLQRHLGVARNQLRIRSGIANDVERTPGLEMGPYVGRLWRKRGGALKKARSR